MVTRLVCVEGWSQIGRWAGLRFADFLAAYPPMPGAKWVALRSKYNIATDTDNTDSNGNPTYTPDPYYVSIDMGTARHPQTLLATEQSGRPLTIGHGAPLRLVVPMKLGLKNIKAISSIEYTVKNRRTIGATSAAPTRHEAIRGTTDCEAPRSARAIVSAELRKRVVTGRSTRRTPSESSSARVEAARSRTASRRTPAAPVRTNQPPRTLRAGERETVPGCRSVERMPSPPPTSRLVPGPGSRAGR